MQRQATISSISNQINHFLSTSHITSNTLPVKSRTFPPNQPYLDHFRYIFDQITDFPTKSMTFGPLPVNFRSHYRLSDQINNFQTISGIFTITIQTFRHNTHFPTSGHNTDFPTSGHNTDFPTKLTTSRPFPVYFPLHHFR